MKNFHQNLLIVLALGLCALCVFQWYDQTAQRGQIQNLSQSAYEKLLTIRDNTNAIATLNHQIAQMDLRITELRESAKTNEELAAAQKSEITKLQAVNAGLTEQIAEYKKGVDALQTKLKETFDGIAKQNKAFMELAAQRDEFVKKFNDSVKDRNEIVAKYNQLAAQVEKLQSAKP